MIGGIFLVTVFEGAWSPDDTNAPVSQEIAFALGDGMAKPWLEDAVCGLRKGEHAHLKEGDVIARTVRVDNVFAPEGDDPPPPAAGETAAEPNGVGPSVGSSDEPNGVGQSGVSPDEPNGGGPPTSAPNASPALHAARELERLRAAGNASLTRAGASYRDWRRAVLLYNRALAWASAAGSPTEMEVKLRLNIALASLKLQRWHGVMLQCDRVLAIDPASAKGYFRRGVARFNAGLGEAAIADLREAHRLCPDDGRILNDLERVIAKQYAGVQKGRQEFAQMYSKMVQGAIFMRRPTAT